MGIIEKVADDIVEPLRFPAHNIDDIVLVFLVMTGEPEIVIQFLELQAAHVSEAMSEDFLAGTIQEENASAQVRGDQTAAHGMNDVFGEILKAEKFFAFLFELHALFAKRLGQ